MKSSETPCLAGNADTVIQTQPGEWLGRVLGGEFGREGASAKPLPRCSQLPSLGLLCTWDVRTNPVLVTGTWPTQAPPLSPVHPQWTVYKTSRGLSCLIELVTRTGLTLPWESAAACVSSEIMGWAYFSTKHDSVLWVWFFLIYCWKDAFNIGGFSPFSKGVFCTNPIVCSREHYWLRGPDQCEGFGCRLPGIFLKGQRSSAGPWFWLFLFLSWLIGSRSSVSMC